MDEIKDKKVWSVLSQIGTVGITALMLFVIAGLFAGSMLQTSIMRLDVPWQEFVTFEKDSILLNIAGLCGFAVLGTIVVWLFGKLRFLKSIKPVQVAAMIAMWVLLFGILWVLQSQSAPTHDSLIVSRAGVYMANGDDQYLQSIYFVHFPFQLGYVLWTEIWARILHVSVGNYLVLEMLNVICLALTEAGLVLIADSIFKDRRITGVTAVLLALFVQPVIFSTFLYGNIPGFCFAVWGIWLYIRFAQTDNLWFAAGSGLSLAFAVGLKLNNMIAFAAVVIITILRLIRKKRLINLAALVMIPVMVLGLKGVGQWQYEKRTGIDFGDGIPLICWMAMGLTDGRIAPGWFTADYTVVNYDSVGGDAEKATGNAVNAIRDRISYFKEHPSDAFTFFSQKALSQWNEPTYQSIWNNQVRGQYSEKTGIAKWVCGEGEKPVVQFMSQGVQAIFFGMLVALLSLLRRKEPEAFLIPLIILGGFLYHMLFEGKSQYVLTYVTMMIPYAVFGWMETVRLVRNGIRRLLPKPQKPKHALDSAA